MFCTNRCAYKRLGLKVQKETYDQGPPLERQVACHVIVYIQILLKYTLLQGHDPDNVEVFEYDLSLCI
jgi:hypothetical protein